MMRIGGLATGLDTDSIVKDLMKIERLKLNKLEQSKQLLEWKKEDYREMINVLRGFKTEFFDILKPDKNMLSANSYKTFKSVSSASEYVTATANGDAVAGTYTITNIVSLATAASDSSSFPISQALQGKQDLSEGAVVKGKSFTLVLDGVSRTITFADDYEDGADLVTALQEEINKAFGYADGAMTTERIKVSLVTDGDGKQTLKLDAGNSFLRVSAAPSGGTDALQALGFSSGQENRINVNASLGSLNLARPILFGPDDTIEFRINGVDFKFHRNDTLRDVMNTINQSAAGVTMGYSSLKDTITLTAKNTGSGEMIRIENLKGNFFASDPSESAIGIAEGVKSNGTNAVLVLNGEVVTRSSNTFTIDGVTYQLWKAFPVDNPPESVDITLTLDVDKAYENIKTFVDKYNELIDKLNTKLNEKRYADYLPLTQEQKDAMTEKEVEKWEERARSGLLKGDSMLQDIVYSMRAALYDEVKSLTDNARGIGINLADIGITTGQYYERGKLYIDESKLKEALRNNPDQVVQLFAQKSDKDYSPDMSQADRLERTKESGLAYRLSDILDDYIRTIRNKDGKKGLLLEKAGIVGDITEFKNMMDEEIKRMEKRIDEMNELLIRREDRYWKQFTALEEAIQRMNMQSAWLAQQFGFGQ